MARTLKFGLPPAPTAEELEEYASIPSASPSKAIAGNIKKEEEGTTPSSDIDLMEALPQMAIHGAVPFGLYDELAGGTQALSEAAAGEVELKNLYNRFRELQKKEESEYKKVQEAYPKLSTAVELGAGFLVPGVGALGKGLSAVTGAQKAIKGLGFGEKIAEHMGTAIALGGLTGAGTSEGTLAGSLGLTEEKGLGSDVLTGMAGGGILGFGTGVLARGKDAIAKKLLEKTDWKVAKAAQELEAGTRPGYKGPVNLTQAPSVTSEELPGIQKVRQRVGEVANELREEGIAGRKQAYEQLNKQLKQEGKRVVSLSPEEIQKSKQSAFDLLRNEIKYNSAFDKVRARYSGLNDDEFARVLNEDIYTNYGRMGDVFKQIMNEYEPRFQTLNEFNQIADKFKQASPAVKRFLKRIDSDIAGKLMRNKPGDAVNISNLFTFRREFLKRAAEEAGDLRLSSADRAFVFGTDDFEGSGIPDIIEDLLKKYIPNITETRGAVGVSSFPLQVILNKSEDVALHRLKPYDLEDEVLASKVQKELHNLITKAAGKGRVGSEAATHLREYFSALEKRNKDLFSSKLISKDQLSAANKKIEQMRMSVQSASEDALAADAIQGIESIAISSPLAPIETAKSLFKGSENLAKIGSIIGGAQTTAREAAQSTPWIIRKPIEVPIRATLDLRKAGVEELKKAAQYLQQSKKPAVANFGRAAEQGLIENSHVGKAAMLNTAYQSPNIRRILGLSVAKEDQQKKKEEEEE